MEACIRCGDNMTDRRQVDLMPATATFMVCDKCGMSHYTDGKYERYRMWHARIDGFDVTWYAFNNSCVYYDMASYRYVDLPWLPYDIAKDRLQSLLAFL